MQPPSSRTLRLVDLAVIGWVVVWLALGTLSSIEVRGLTSLSDTMQVAGESLEQAGGALGTAAAIPLVGGGIRPAAERVQQLAAQTIDEAEESRTHIDRLSWLVLVLGGVLPASLGIAVYVPLRRVWIRPQPTTTMPR